MRGMSAQIRRAAGFSLIEMMTALFLSSLVLTAAFSDFFHTTRRGEDAEMVTRTQLEARKILDMMAFELRMAGSGMPLGQQNYLITDLSLGTAPYPVLLTSTATTIAFRMNEKGTQSVTTAAYTPSSASLTFSVLSTAGFSVGDIIYLSNMTVGGQSGLRGTLSAVTSSSLSISSGYVASLSASFAAGSTVDRVNTITYASTASGITRNDGSGAVVIAPRSSFTASYLDAAGTSMTLPLTAATLNSNLSAIALTVSVASEHVRMDKRTYTAQATQRVALRNLSLMR